MGTTSQEVIEYQAQIRAVLTDLDEQTLAYVLSDQIERFTLNGAKSDHQPDYARDATLIRDWATRELPRNPVGQPDDRPYDAAGRVRVDPDTDKFFVNSYDAIKEADCLYTKEAMLDRIAYISWFTAEELTRKNRDDKRGVTLPDLYKQQELDWIKGRVQTWQTLATVTTRKFMMYEDDNGVDADLITPVFDGEAP